MVIFVFVWRHGFREPRNIRNVIAFQMVILFLYMLRGGVKEHMHVNDAENFAWNKRDFFVPRSIKKRDWHNYEQIQNEETRVGLGEQGRPAYLPSGVPLEEQLCPLNAFNVALSDRIALNRSLPDVRHQECAGRLYLESLPAVSVVVPFHNEPWSTMLRTVHSAVLRSPPKLIKEVLLVDDASTAEFLKQKLDEYLAANLPVARVIRLPTRSGLITARLAGAQQASADVLVFLDSHTEANVNWLPPLLEPIALNRRVVVCPFIDGIAFDTFEYRSQAAGRGAFNWEFHYKRLQMLPRDEENLPEPFESPVMAGGLFAISRSFFWELGGYDPGLHIWGGEQYELSFKIWMCGGRMVDAPCSRVGHVYRKYFALPDPGRGEYISKNYRRVAEVWMDEYAQYLYARRPHYLRIDPGDLTQQRIIRDKLKCKPFKWFITQVAFDLTANFPPIEPSPFGGGRIKPATHPQVCVDARNVAMHDKLKLRACGASLASEQQFTLTWHKDIRLNVRTYMCWHLVDFSPESPVLLMNCLVKSSNQRWRYHSGTKQIKHSSSNCLDWDVPTRFLFINPCVDSKETQQWTIEHVHRDVMAKWDDIKIDQVTGPVT